MMATALHMSDHSPDHSPLYTDSHVVKQSLHDSDDDDDDASVKDKTLTDVTDVTDDENDPAAILRKLLKGKAKEWNAVSQRTGKLTLLELPVDILRLIVKEITHTNDLTSLALANSTLHNLAVPHIYSRFDIVWPDATQMSSSDTKSVDALTYGLSTISVGSSFAFRTRRLLYPDTPADSATMRRLKNDYARHTRKFSLGNGPNDWVAEYMITKESGKMLGTLVALAVEKMVNLETFIWDMPTGVLSDIFMALAALGERHPDNDSKLDRVWVRWHDNSEGAASSASTSPAPANQPQAVVPLGSTLTPIGILIPSSAVHPAPRAPISYAESRVEFPTFSVLPALKSLTVLDIDEIAYLDEMAMVIERSKDRLQELRVGISAKATHKDFVQTWDGTTLQQVDYSARWPGESTIGERRLGGVLGVLVGRVYDIRKKNIGKSREKGSMAPVVAAEQNESSVPPAPEPVEAVASDPQTDDEAESNVEHQDGTPVQAEDDGNDPEPELPEPLVESAAVAAPDEDAQTPTADDVTAAKRRPLSRTKSSESTDTLIRKRLEGKLKLQTLELERVPLSMQVCSKAFDWTVLTNLTILECAQHETLWKILRRQFQPTPFASGFNGPPTTKQASSGPLQYHLCLKKIHTDITSTTLINFIKETLAPNSLEALFLQDRRRSGPPTVTIDQIFKGALKRHRSSIRKLLLDSSDRNVRSGSATENLRWRNWILSTDMLMYMTSGRMSNLRELAVSIDYKDWHTFLQRLPNIPQLRSLNFPNLADHVPSTFEPKELALHIVDIITLRPEIQLCYVGIATKCFEILETRPSDTASGGSNATVVVDHHATGHEAAGDGGEEDGSDDDTASQVDDTTDDDDDEDDTPASVADPDETQSEASDASDSDDDSFRDADQGNRPRLRLREILFYDDKVAIFKARHGRL